MASSSNKELESRCKQLTEDISEGLHILSHDPSLALYRLQEHIRKSLPVMVEKRDERVFKIQLGVTATVEDIEIARISNRYPEDERAVQSMSRSSASFSKTYEFLRSSMYYKQQLDYERMREDKKGKFFGHSDSSDSLVQEMRKTRSLGYLKDSASDSMSESVASRSTASTPVSEYPESLITKGDTRTTSPSCDDPLEILSLSKAETLVGKPGSRSSTPTSGADSSDDGDELNT